MKKLSSTSNANEMTFEEAKEIYTAWMAGDDYPIHLLPAAILKVETRKDDEQE